MESITAETAYATKGNILYPGTSAQATVAQTKAQTDMNNLDSLTGVTTTVPGSAIKPAT